MRPTVGLVHPGEMGAAVGAQLVEAGHTVMWASTGRSPATVERARTAGLTDCGELAAVAARSDVILSICPPAAAVDVAQAVVGLHGIYVDANAIAPATSRQIAGLVETGGATFVDGGIIGGPPRAGGDMRLYLSGARAAEIGGLFEATAVGVVVLEAPIGAASAVKMAYAGWTKGSAALVIAVAEYARAEGVDSVLAEEWRRSQPDLARRLERARLSARTKGWRWVGEMNEIAAALASTGLPAGFHEAAATIFERGE